MTVCATVIGTRWLWSMRPWAADVLARATPSPERRVLSTGWFALDDVVSMGKRLEHNGDSVGQ